MQVINGRQYRGPLYLKWRFNQTGLAVDWSMRDYGGIGETTMIVAAEVDTVQHTYLAGQADVYALPENIDVTPSPQELNAFEARLEAAYIAADWLSPSQTWREALRTVLGMFSTAGKYAVLVGNSILDDVTNLNTQYRNMPQTTQDALAQIATNMNYPWSEIRDNWTARRLLKWFSDQWPNDSFQFGNLITV